MLILFIIILKFKKKLNLVLNFLITPFVLSNLRSFFPHIKPARSFFVSPKINHHFHVTTLSLSLFFFLSVSHILSFRSGYFCFVSVLFCFQMVMEDNESCGSRPNDPSSLYSPALSPSPSLQSQTRQQRQKLEVYNEVLRRLKDSNNDEALQPGFDDQLWSHFNRLPTRYHTFALNLHIYTHIYSFVNVCTSITLCITLIDAMVLLRLRYFMYTHTQAHTHCFDLCLDYWRFNMAILAFYDLLDCCDYGFHRFCAELIGKVFSAFEIEGKRVRC